MESSNRGHSCCGFTARRPPTAGGSCRAVFAGFPIAWMRVPLRWATVSNPQMSGCSRQTPVKVSSLLPSPETALTTRLLGNLPSRAADNLFWFGRYLERAEATLRVVRCLGGRSVDPDTPPQLGRQSLDRLMGVLLGWGAVDPKTPRKGAVAASEQGLRNAANYGSVLSLSR